MDLPQTVLPPDQLEPCDSAVGKDMNGCAEIGTTEVSCPVRDTYQILRELTIACTFIRPGTKRPRIVDWTHRAAEWAEYQPGEGLAILTGALSGNLVCVDIDHSALLAVADDYLPATGLIEGRASKPRSHRYYRVMEIPPDALAGDDVAGGIGGPRTRRFRAADRTPLMDLLGTGSLVVVPPSVHKSGEQRCWDSCAEPAVVPYNDLLEAVQKLAATQGWIPRPGSKRGEIR